MFSLLVFSLPTICQTFSISSYELQALEPSVLWVCPKSPLTAHPTLFRFPLLASHSLLRSLSSSILLLNTADFLSQEATRHLLTGFVLEHPGTKSLILEEEIWEQHLQMPERQQLCGKILPTSPLGEEGQICGMLSPVGWGKPALVGLEGAVGGRRVFFW